MSTYSRNTAKSRRSGEDRIAAQFAVQSRPEIPADSQEPTASTRASDQEKRPAKVSARVWKLSGEFIEFGKEALHQHPKINRRNFAIDFSNKVNSKRPNESLRDLRAKFPGKKSQPVLQWVLRWMVEQYWIDLPEGDHGPDFHQVRFLTDDFEELMYRGLTMYEIERLREKGFPRREYSMKLHTPEETEARQKAAEERTVRKWLADQGFESASLYEPTNEEEPQS